MILSLMILCATVFSINSLIANEAGAAAVANPYSCAGENSFFGFKPWYAGLTELKGSRCEIGTPTNIPLFVWTIVLNILVDISVLVGYVAVLMFGWGGYLYMFSRGMPERAERGKKTLISAAVGLLISILASVIMNTIVTILTRTS